MEHMSPVYTTTLGLANGLASVLLQRQSHRPLLQRQLSLIWISPGALALKVRHVHPVEPCARWCPRVLDLSADPKSFIGVSPLQLKSVWSP